MPSKFTRVLRTGAAIAALTLSAPGTAFAAGWLAPVSVSAIVTGGLNARVAMNARGDMTVAWQHGNGAAMTVQASVRPFGGSFSAPVTVAAAGETGSAPQVGIDSAGNAGVAWRRDVAGKGTVRAALRPAGGVFAEPVDVSAVGEDASVPQLALSAGGDAVVTWVRLDGTHTVVRALTRSAAGAVSGPVDVSSASEDAREASVAIDRAGNALVAWLANGAAVKRAERPAGGSFSAPVQLSAAGEAAIVPDVAVGDGGAAIVTWSRASASGWVPRAVVRAAGSAFDQPKDIACAGAAGAPTVEMNARGDAAFVWEYAGQNLGVRASVRPAGGAFSGPPLNLSDDGAVPAVAINAAGDVFLAWRDYQGDDGEFAVRVRGAKLPAGASAVTASKIISPVADENDAPQLAVDDADDAVAVWRPIGIYTGFPPDGENISSGTIGASVFDGTPPQLSSVSVPATATAGSPAAMSAAGSDAWSPATVRFDFGDGASQTGDTVSHAYAAAGTYVVTVTATDEAGNTATSTRTIGVAAAPTTDPPGNSNPTQNTNTSPSPGTNTNPGTTGPSATQTKAQLLAQIVPKGSAAKLAKLAKLVKTKRYRLSYKALTAGTATIRWSAKSGGKTIVIATGTRRFMSAGTATIDIKLTARGVKLLKRAKRVRVTATSTFAAPGAAAVTAAKTFVLKR